MCQKSYNNDELIRKLLSPVRCFLLDMDGTFYLGNRLLEGSIDFLSKLAQTDRQALFVTNNSSKSGSMYVQKLKNMGVPLPFLHVLTSGQATGRYCLRRFAGKRPYILGTPALREELAAMGLQHDEQNPDYVLMAYDTTLTYESLTRVCDLVRTGLPYIATHPDFNCPTEEGFAPDIGATIAFVKASTGRDPDLIIGKPHAEIMEEVLLRTGFPKEAMAMVGDRLYTDIATGVHFGMTSILVLTGETQQQDLSASPIKPTLVVDRLADLTEFL